MQLQEVVPSGCCHPPALISPVLRSVRSGAHSAIKSFFLGSVLDWPPFTKLFHMGTSEGQVVPSPLSEEASILLKKEGKGRHAEIQRR